MSENSVSESHETVLDPDELCRFGITACYLAVIA